MWTRSRDGTWRWRAPARRRRRADRARLPQRHHRGEDGQAVQPQDRQRGDDRERASGGRSLRRRPAARPRPRAAAAAAPRGTSPVCRASPGRHPRGRPGGSRSTAPTPPGRAGTRSPTIAAVAPSAKASARHSRRTANHSTPMPGVTFVMNISVHDADQRKPTTIATVEQVDVAGDDLERDRQEQQRRQRPAAHQPPQRRAVERRPQGDEDVQRQPGQRREELGERRRVEVGADRPVSAAA